MKQLVNVSYYTFKDLIKSKVLLNVFFLGIALLIVSFVASEVTFGVPRKVALDFGLGVLTLSNVAISILLGAGLISNEIENRTIFMILSRPISRHLFLMGKVLGMSGILILNMFLLSSMVIGFYLSLGGELYHSIFWSLVFIFFEGLISLLLVVLFSLVTNKTLSVIFSFTLFVSGHAVNDIVIERFKMNPLLNGILSNYHYVLPRFDKFNFKDFVVHGESVDPNLWMNSLYYCIFYSVALVLMGCWILSKKNID